MRRKAGVACFEISIFLWSQKSKLPKKQKNFFLFFFEKLEIYNLFVIEI